MYILNGNVRTLYDKVLSRLYTKMAFIQYIQGNAGRRVFYGIWKIDKRYI